MGAGADLLVAGEGDLLLVADGAVELERRHGAADLGRGRDHGGDRAAAAAEIWIARAAPWSDASEQMANKIRGYGSYL